MERVILHSDLNSFYASVELLYRPDLREKPVAVSGDVEQRHGIILTANRLAKSRGVKTGQAIWQARQTCPNLVTLPPDYKKYIRFSHMARKIYLDYTDKVEPFGIDEAWLDVSGSVGLFGSGEEIANIIRHRIESELGITASVGVSFNKVFAKLGSDYKKPNATTVISKENFKSIVWPLPAKDLLYVGSATARKLYDVGILTIGQLDDANLRMLELRFGKWGIMLWRFANGYDTSPVATYGDECLIKSIGNSATTPRDLVNDDDARLMLYVLSDSVAERMRDNGFLGRVVSISVRDCKLRSFTRQRILEHATCLTEEISNAAFALFQKHYHWEEPIRSIGVNLSDLSHKNEPIQLDVFCDWQKREQKQKLECTVDWLRRRYGHDCVRRGIVMADKDFAHMNPKGEHTIHPTGYFNGGGSIG